MKLQFRLEAINALNYTVLWNPDTNPRNATFGFINQDRNNRGTSRSRAVYVLIGTRDQGSGLVFRHRVPIPDPRSPIPAAHIIGPTSYDHGRPGYRRQY